MAKQLYEDGTIITQAFRFNSAGVTTPIDVRLVATGQEALYINATNPTNSPLYGRAYRGMPIAIVDESVGSGNANDVKIYVLKNELPYKFGSPGNVDVSNFFTYWTEIGKSLNDEITGQIQPTIECLVEYIKAENVSVGKGLIVDPSTYDITKNGVTVKNALAYKVDVDVDSSTVSFNDNNKLTTGLYRVIKEGTGNSAIYKLQFKNANGSTYSDVENSSSIQFEDWALNSKVDEVITNLNDTSAALSAKLIDTSTAINNHINSSYVEIKDAIDSSYVEIKDAIDSSYVEIKDAIDSSYVEIKDAINSSYVEIKDAIDSSYVEIKERLAIIDSSIEDGDMMYTSNVDDAVTTLTDHGSLPAGTSAGTLKEYTLSQIFDMILFETAEPTKDHNASGSASWVSGSKYASNVDMGTKALKTDAEIRAQLKLSFTNETWTWKSKVDASKTGTTNVVGASTSTGFYASSNSEQGTYNDASEVLLTEENPSAYYYLEVQLNALSNAKDSLGKDKNASNVFYAKATDRASSNDYTTSTVDSSKKKITTARLKTTAAWRAFTNANYFYTNAKDAYDNKLKAQEETFKGNNSLSSTFDAFLTVATKGVSTGTVQRVFFSWTNNYTSDDHFYICIPSNCTVESAYFVSDDNLASTDYAILFPASGGNHSLGKKGSDTQMSSIVPSGQGTAQTRYFSKYEIGKANGVTTVMITIKRTTA